MVEPRELEGIVAQIASKYGLFHANSPVQDCLNNSFLVLNQTVIECEKRGDMRYGIITKPSGTNAYGYSADNIAFKDGSNHFDVIANADAEDSDNDGIRDPQSPSFGENGPISANRVVPPRYDMALDNSNPIPIPDPNPNPDPEPPSNIDKKLDTILLIQKDMLSVLKNMDIMLNIIERKMNPDYVGKQSGWAGGTITLTPR